MIWEVEIETWTRDRGMIDEEVKWDSVRFIICPYSVVPWNDILRILNATYLSYTTLIQYPINSATIKRAYVHIQSVINWFDLKLGRAQVNSCNWMLEKYNFYSSFHFYSPFRLFVYISMIHPISLYVLLPQWSN